MSRDGRRPDELAEEDHRATLTHSAPADYAPAKLAAATGERPSTGRSVEGYVDIYLLPVPEKNLEAYRRQAATFGTVAKEHGALSYREFLGDDLDDALKVAEGELLTSAVAEFESRAHRDEVMDRVMKDPRVTDMVGGEQIADMSRMRYGGFQAFVNS